MINGIRAQYETLLLYHPNGTFVLLLLFFVFLIFSLFSGFFIVIRLFRSVGTSDKLPFRIYFGKTISIERFIHTVRVFLRMIDIIEQRIMRRIHNVVDTATRELLVSDHERDR